MLKLNNHKIKSDNENNILQKKTVHKRIIINTHLLYRSLNVTALLPPSSFIKFADSVGHTVLNCLERNISSL